MTARSSARVATWASKARKVSPAACALVPLSSGTSGRNREAASKVHDGNGALVTEKCKIPPCAHSTPKPTRPGWRPGRSCGTSPSFRGGCASCSASAFKARSLGRCSPRTGLIRLNPGLLDGPPTALREVVCHEVAHVATWILHGRKAAAHGREWKELMQRAGYDPRVRWAEATVPDAVRERRRKTAVYVHSCPVCRAQWIARRTVTTWRCATCRKAGRDGRLTVSKREAGSNAELA